MNDELKYKEVIDKFVRMMSKYGEMEKKPRDYGTGDLLFPSEIHTMDVIGDNPGINITELSEKLGVSKSAISQIVNKLERKKYVRRYKEQDNGKSVLLQLLQKGQLAFVGHKKYHLSMDLPLIETMKGWDDNQFAFLSEVLDEMYNYGERVMIERSH
jgi:DNA-binding MarR family transcriptional regulator